MNPHITSSRTCFGISLWVTIGDAETSSARRDLVKSKSNKVPADLNHRLK